MVMFDRSLEKLSFFLWSHLGRYALTYSDKVTIVNAVTDNLKGEAAEWVTGLHDQNWEISMTSWWNSGPGLKMRSKMKAASEIRQGSQPMAEYIWEFWRVAGKLRHWPEWLLVYHFKNDLNSELFHACLSWGIPYQIHDRYRMATVIDLDMREYKNHGDPDQS